MWLRSRDPQGTILSAHIGPFLCEAGGSRARQRYALILLRPFVWQPHLEEQLVALFGLTMAEARVARSLADGLQASAIADLHGVRVSTIRTHISNILAKSGARQQNEFFAILGQMQLPVLP